MADECVDCRKSIFNTQTTTIAVPECQDDCPEDVNCDGEVTYSDCINVNVALSCSETAVGASLTTVLQSIDTKICNNQESTCTVSVSSDDTCCGYLQDKITVGTGLTKTITNEGACEKVNISVNPGTIVWNNLPLSANFATITGYQIPQYSEPDALGRVWFRGVFTYGVGNIPAGGAISLISAALTAAYRPLYIRTYFSGKSSVSGTGTPQLIFNPNGTITFKNTTVSQFDSKGIFSLDGFVIEKN